MKEPAALREMERVQMLAERHGGVVRKTYSLVDILKDLNQTFHDDDPAWYTPAREPRAGGAVPAALRDVGWRGDREARSPSDQRRAGLELRLALGPTSKIAALSARSRPTSRRSRS